ncbi:AAA family ATPase [Nocardia sp. NPDC058497]|uniref:AAA family ATPase n=1 Tax=Nocardia sp. NPDC058497 TaxID=3346529 RepID=UPI003667106C
MDKLLVLVNGLPGSGKSTLGRSLAQTLGAQFLSKDIVKEALATCVEGALAIPEIGGIAMDALWALARATPETVVIDSWWFKPRDLQLAAAGVKRSAADLAVEVWCDAPAEVARARYAARRRAPLHRDDQRLADDWTVWAEQAEPLGLTPVVVIDTTRPVDCADLVEQIKLVASPLPSDPAPHNVGRDQKDTADAALRDYVQRVRRVEAAQRLFERGQQSEFDREATAHDEVKAARKRALES